MRLEAELTANTPGYIPDFGYVSKDEPLRFDEFKMVRIEAKRRCKFGEIVMPPGVSLTVHILEDEEEGQ